MGESTYSRLIGRKVEAALRDAPVVAVIGPRQAGKSTLVRDLVRLPQDAVYVTLDDPLPLAAARADPDGFLSGYDVPLVIDEAQRVPDLFRAIKRSVDRDRRPGRFLLTGSADIFHLPRMSETLAGRVDVSVLWPLSQNELEAVPGSIVDRLFEERAPSPPANESRRSVLARALRGGFPEAVGRAADRRGAWFDSYAATVVQREVRDIAAIERITELDMLLRLLAARSGSVLNVSELGRAAGMSQTTLTRYLAILELAFLIVRVPAWSGSPSRRLLKHPKVVMSDAGLAAHLAGIDATRAAADGRLVGPLLESFVAMELTKHLGWSATHARLYHWRSVAGSEVDLVLERTDGTVVAIEVKASERLDARDVAGIRRFADDVGRRFHRGVVLYLGQDVVPFDRAIHAVPLAVLWGPASRRSDRIRAPRRPDGPTVLRRLS